MKEIVLASRNHKKKLELRRLLKDVKVKVLDLTDFPRSPKVKEDGKTFLANAAKKARVVSRFTKQLTLADDSGLMIDFLKGAPGIYSARFAGKAQNDLQNNRKVLRLLRGVPLKKRKAQFVCAIALAKNGQVLKTLQDKCSGLIAFACRGRHGFGYDPLFLIPKYQKTFAQLGPRIKDSLSHRAKALRRARRYLLKYL
jgi:XTP/dITP diphosphohydrolase